ncbi:aminopeptidase C [Capnocytophaga catalasegens]|uniref:Aminopeptidase n=1 Tax=Capnocytophaga catalasegens TaxID=1004260 RepID=A0AAV5AUM3_9FLAO|nr:C1 family peptidase [Capnocytophaga catalasegens]GIZ15666.1 aminopeptidase [Capnocytophaga catalasegens]GJM49561.1 aminopeptidase [Capnocytophaga catalasegens]GJM51730.1 aminopeptidase [Capnocytophaga catalasegens]
MKKIIYSLIFGSFFIGSAQDNLIKSVEGNHSQKAGFQFTTIINLERTEVKDQGSSGTCWSYTGASFLESEMIRMGKTPVDLSEIFTARNTYIEKAKQYVRMHGHLDYGDGGELHDIINIYAKYGAVPQQVYSGLNYGTTRNNFDEMQAGLKGFLEGIVKRPNVKKLTPNWDKAFIAALDAYLGEVPESFFFNNKKYTPESFAKEVVGINPLDYIEFLSYENQPKYQNVLMAVPDNWSYDWAFNIEMNDIIQIIDNALKKGYTIAWASDVSERYFSWRNGVAFVPEQDWDDMTPEQRNTLFDNPPTKERTITPQIRQQAFDNWETTDDHAMHIVGLAKDQNGREYYIVKNSWGINNDYQGYLYVTKTFVTYKTTALLVHKDAVPNAIMKNYKKK